MQLLSCASGLIVQHVVVPAVVSNVQMYIAHTPVRVLQEKSHISLIYILTAIEPTLVQVTYKKSYDQEALKLLKITELLSDYLILRCGAWIF